MKTRQIHCLKFKWRPFKSYFSHCSGFQSVFQSKNFPAKMALEGADGTFWLQFTTHLARVIYRQGEKGAFYMASKSKQRENCKSSESWEVGEMERESSRQFLSFPEYPHFCFIPQKTVRRLRLSPPAFWEGKQKTFIRSNSGFRAGTLMM